MAGCAHLNQFAYGRPMVRITDLAVPDSPNGKEVLIPATRGEWRSWLASNGDRRDGLWVVFRNKSSDLEGPLYDDLVEESLCHGWIDSQARRVDDDRRIQWFSPRRPGGIWSPLNKERIERLTRAGLMTEMGQVAIDRAMADGSWSQTDELDALIVPPDLAAAFAAAPEARSAYGQLPDSLKRQHLWAVYSAKRPETRAERIARMIDSLGAD